MTTEELKMIIEAHARYDAADAAGDEEACEEILQEFPCLFYYDSRGRYVGPVSNENGWTP